MKALYAFLDDFRQECLTGTITISENIEFSMRQTVRQISTHSRRKYS